MTEKTEKLLNETNKKINSLLSLCVKLANVSDRDAEKGIKPKYLDDVGMGYLAFSRTLRDGAKAIIDMQMILSEAISKAESESEDAENVRDFLEECFGDREIDTINDKDKERIISLCNTIHAEWEEEWKKNETND